MTTTPQILDTVALTLLAEYVAHTGTAGLVLLPSADWVRRAVALVAAQLPGNYDQPSPATEIADLTPEDIEATPNMFAICNLVSELAHRAILNDDEATGEVTAATKFAAQAALRTRIPQQMIDVVRQQLIDCNNGLISPIYRLTARKALGTAP